MRRWALGQDFAPPKCAELPFCVTSAATAAADGAREEGMANALSPASSSVRVVRRGDLDMNRHTNNAKYLEWLLEDVPAALCGDDGGGSATDGAAAAGVQQRAAWCAGADIEFRAETGLDDELRSCCVAEPSGGGAAGSSDGNAAGVDNAGGVRVCHHALVRTGDGVEVLRARTLWRHHAA